MIPGPGTLTSVRTVLPTTSGVRTVKTFDGGAGIVSNVAVTDCAWVIATVQVAAVPEQAPLQPEKVEPLAGAAVSVTDVPPSKFAEQVAPQSIPAGEEETAPDPVPAFVIESA